LKKKINRTLFSAPAGVKARRKEEKVHKEEDLKEKPKELSALHLLIKTYIRFSFLSFPVNLLLCDLCAFAVNKKLREYNE